MLILSSALTCTAHVGSVAADGLSAAQRSDRDPPSSVLVPEIVPFLTYYAPAQQSSKLVPPLALTLAKDTNSLRVVALYIMSPAKYRVVVETHTHSRGPQSLNSPRMNTVIQCQDNSE